MNIVSNSVNDTLAGTGARTFRIKGLDGDYNLIQENLILDGLSIVTTVNSYLRVYRTEVLTAGSTEINQGVITTTASSSAKLQSSILADKGVSHQGHFTIPNNYVGLLIAHFVSCFRKAGGSGTRVAEINFLTKKKDAAWHRAQTLGLNNIGTGTVQFKYPFPLVLSEKTDTKLVGVPESNATSISASSTFILLKGKYTLNSDIF